MNGSRLTVRVNLARAARSYSEIDSAVDGVAVDLCEFIAVNSWPLIAPRLSSIWDPRLAPVSTVVTRESRSSDRIATCTASGLS